MKTVDFGIPYNSTGIFNEFRNAKQKTDLLRGHQILIRSNLTGNSLKKNNKQS